MPAASDEELVRALHEVQAFEMKHPEAFKDLEQLIGRNRRIGYKNLSKMLLGSITEEDLVDGD